MLFFAISLFAGVLLLGAAGWLLGWRPAMQWRLTLRKWSSWLSVVNAGIVTHMMQQSGMLLQFVPRITRDFQTVAVIGIFLVWAAVPVIVANIHQPKLEQAKERANAGCP